jgi:hypothetical protein
VLKQRIGVAQREVYLLHRESENPFCPFGHVAILGDVTKNSLIALAIALALASIVLSLLFKGIFLVLLIPAFFALNSGRSKDDR